MKTIRVMRNIVGSAGLIYFGYLLVTAMPELKRYLKISTM